MSDRSRKTCVRFTRPAGGGPSVAGLVAQLRAFRFVTDTHGRALVRNIIAVDAQAAE
jgi:hypothetical protein